MKNPRFVLACAALLCGPALFAADPQPASVPPVVIPNSELRVLPPSASGRHYELFVSLPPNYRSEPGKRYPVVYVTDAYWDFQKVSAIQGSLIYDHLAPEFIVVGIGYAGDNLDYNKMRLWELAPAPIPGMSDAEAGHAAEFLQSIKNEIIPFVEKEYRVDASFRVMSGSSMGGLFTLYAMLTEPDLFQGYVAASPAVVACNEWLFGHEQAFAKSGRAIKARCFASVGGNEVPQFISPTLRFNQQLASRHYQGLSYQFRYIEEQRHSSMQYDSYVRGLIFVFAPLAPDSGPAGKM